MKRTLRKIFLIVLICLAIVFAFWRWHLAQAVNREIAAIHAAGLPVNHAELDRWYPQVPDSENAALALPRAFELMQEYPPVVKGPDDTNDFSELPPVGIALPAAQKEFLAGYVDMNH